MYRIKFRTKYKVKTTRRYRKHISMPKRVSLFRLTAQRRLSKQKKHEELQLNKTAGISPISYTDPGDYICQMVFHVLRLQSLLWVLF